MNGTKKQEDEKIKQNGNETKKQKQKTEPTPMSKR